MNSYFLPLLVMIIFVDHFFFALVFLPGATTLPLNALGYFKPIDVLPSHHPCGWSTGFIDLPRLNGLIHFRLCLHALPMTTFLWSSLLTLPIDARHSSWNFLTSPDANLIKTTFKRASLPTTAANEPAAFTSFPFVWGVSSRLCTSNHSGIYFNGLLFP